MRPHLLFALAISAALATGAYAQTVDPPGNIEAGAGVWDQTPSMADFERIFPVQARRHNLSGRVVLECKLDSEGRLVHCAIVEESPLGVGFGYAALDLSSLFQMAPAAREQLSSDTIRLPLSFQTQEETG